MSNYSVGISLGAAIAAAQSVVQHNALLWVILHAVFGWFYVLWWYL